MEESMKLGNYIDLGVLQNILDNFAKATEISFVAVDYKGTPVTRYSGFTNFCNMLRTHDEYKAICYQCDAHGGLQAAITGRPCIYKCHTGLVDFAVPIMVKGNYLGAILAGQVKVEEEHRKSLNLITGLECDWKSKNELLNAYHEISEVPYEKVLSTAYTIHEISNYIVEKEYINIVKKKLNTNQMKLLKEERKRSELEKSLKEAELKALYYQINPHFLFNALNTICRLAFLEKAERTEEIAYAFSDMMRYVLKKNNSQLVTIKDEVIHSRNYLKIQKIRLGERLNYNIDISEKYENIQCPFMILQPLIENSVKYVAEAKEKGGNINIRGYDDGTDLIIEIEDNGDGISEDQIFRLIHTSSQNNIRNDSIGIHNVNKRLIYLFGESYGLQVISENKPGKGTIVRIRVKLNNMTNDQEQIY
nr:PocR ligand-binding domain-containing protein [Sedimentibacter sp.]